MSLEEYQKAINAFADSVVKQVALIKEIKRQAEAEGLAPEELEEYIKKNYPQLPVEMLHL